MRTVESILAFLIFLLSGCGITRGPVRFSDITLSYDHSPKFETKQIHYWVTFEIMLQPDHVKPFNPDWRKIIEYWNLNLENKDLIVR